MDKGLLNVRDWNTRQKCVMFLFYASAFYKNLVVLHSKILTDLLRKWNFALTYKQWKYLKNRNYSHIPIEEKKQC